MAEQLARIQSLIDTTENWKAANPILLNGEIGFEIKNKGNIAMKVGDGVTSWGSLPYATRTEGENSEQYNNLQKQIDNIVLSSSDSGDVTAEVVQARVDVDGLNFATLKERLDAEQTILKNVSERLGKSNYKYDVGYRDLFGSKIGELEPNDMYQSVLIPVIAGQKVKISGEGVANGAAQIWGVADVNGVITRKSGTTTIASGLEITIAEGERYFVTNSIAEKTHSCETVSSTVELSQHIVEDFSNTKAEKNFVNQMRKCDKWWGIGNEVFESLSDEKKMAFMKIAEFNVKTYTPNTTAYLYGCSVNSDGSYSLKCSWTGLSGTQTFAISLPASDVYTTVTVSNKNKKSRVDVSITYTTKDSKKQTLLTDTEQMNVNVQYDGESFEKGLFDNRIVDKIYIRDDISGVKLIRTQNMNPAYIGSAYWYYTEFLLTFKNGITKKIIKSSADAQTGIIEENLDNAAVVFLNADVISGQNTELVGINADLDLKNATHYSPMLDSMEVHRIENDLRADGTYNLTECKTFKNGSAGEFYGQDNVRYRFKVGEERKNLHLYFEYQWTSAPVYVTDAQHYTIAKVYGGLVAAVQYYRGINASNLRRHTIFGMNNEKMGTATNVLDENDILPSGNLAFWIQYTGEVASSTSDVTCSFNDGTVTIAHSSTSEVIGTVTYQNTDSVDSLVNALNSIEGVECGAVETTGHICGELIPSEENVTFSLWKKYTDSQNATQYDYPKIDVYYAHDTTWHSCEIVVDIENLKAYVAYDGKTISSGITLNAASSQYVEIGGSYGDAETPIRVRNLEIDYDSFGDAEIIKSVAPPYSDGLTQLISNHNPKLLIFEGHGVDVGVDANAPYSDDMAVTTDRLHRVFTELHKKGYVPVTWQEIINWKLSGGKLPKRCFQMMFDDWRFENFVDYDKRVPFEKFNVKPGLSTFSSNKNITDIEEINGVQYKVSDIIRMTMTAGWYPCSHTRNHRNNTDVAPSELDALLRTDVLECNALGIYSDIMVYPFGGYNVLVGRAINRSPFKLGVNVVINKYNCKMTNNATLGRVEIGTRQSLEDVLAPIV